MSTVLVEKAKMPAGKQEKEPAQIPNYLIYEVSKGKPIYYKGYKEVLKGTKTLEEIKVDSILQSWLKAYITGILFIALRDKPYDLMTGELGLNLPQQDKRGADISIFKSERLELKPFYSDIPPDIIIEIDLKADPGEHSEMDYVLQKIQDYLDFGVQKVFWIFTKPKNVMIADSSLPWLTYDWDKDVEIMEGVSFNLNKILEERKEKV